jgi:hypothetical protein
MNAEILVLVFATFKRYNGAYFWSILATASGLIIYTTAFLLVNFENPFSPVVINAMLNVGFTLNTFGYPLVLWSRLHLVIGYKPRFLKAVLVLIITICVGTVVTALAIGYGVFYKHPEKFLYELIANHVEAFALALQDLFIAVVYIYETSEFLKSGYSIQTRKVIGLLVVVQSFCVAVDITVIASSFNQARLAGSITPVVISVKLRLEFVVLNQLRSLVKRGLAPALSLRSAPRVRGQHLESAKGADQAPGESLQLPKPERIANTEQAALSSSASPGTTPCSCGVSGREKQNLHDPDEILSEEAKNLARSSVDDLEAMYLGQWHGEMKG